VSVSECEPVYLRHVMITDDDSNTVCDSEFINTFNIQYSIHRDVITVRWSVYNKYA